MAQLSGTAEIDARTHSLNRLVVFALAQIERLCEDTGVESLLSSTLAQTAALTAAESNPILVRSGELIQDALREARAKAAEL